MPFGRTVQACHVFAHATNSPKTVGKTVAKCSIASQYHFRVFAQVRIQVPHAFAQNLLPQDFFLHVLVLYRGVTHIFVENHMAGDLTSTL